MRALLLAAGFGTRLGDLTRQTPKPLLPVGEHRLIDWPLACLRQAGISEIVVNLHHHTEQVRTYLESLREFHFHYSVEEPDILGTGGGIAKAREFLGEEPFVVYNGDVVCDIDLQDVIHRHQATEAVATLVTVSRPGLSNNGEIEIDPSGRVTRILGQPAAAPAGQARVFTGIHILNPAVFDYLQPVFSSVIREFYQPALRQGRMIAAHDHIGFWEDAGSSARYENLTGRQLPTILTFL